MVCLDFMVISFLETLDIRKYHGIGKVTTKKMYALGIFTGKELKTQSEEFLTKHFGKAGRYYYQAVRGIHTSEVKPSRIPKSMGAERTFSENLTSELFLEEKINAVAIELDKRIKLHKASGKTITLKIKYSDFMIQTRSKTLPFFIADKSMIIAYAKQLLYQEKLQNSVRLIGLTISNLNNQETSPKKEDSKNTLDVQLELPF